MPPPPTGGTDRNPSRHRITKYLRVSVSDAICTLRFMSTASSIPATRSVPPIGVEATLDAGFAEAAGASDSSASTLAPTPQRDRASIRRPRRGRPGTTWGVRWREDGRFHERFGFQGEGAAREYIATTIQAPQPTQQLTRPRYLYAIQAGVDGPIKIGCASNTESRLRQLRTGNYEELHTLGVGVGSLAAEKEIHDALAPYRIRSEWYRPAPAVIEAVEHIRGAA